jgi:RNA polymerase sigma-70 factor (ECF subfamily)
MDRQQENRIIIEVLQGDRQKYSLLVEHYKGHVFHLAYRMTGDLSEAEDLTQETFIRAYLHLSKFHPDRSFFTWLYTIGINLIRNQRIRRMSPRG